jgi:hypothetical protein
MANNLSFDHWFGHSYSSSFQLPGVKDSVSHEQNCI